MREKERFNQRQGKTEQKEIKRNKIKRKSANQREETNERRTQKEATNTSEQRRKKKKEKQQTVKGRTNRNKKAARTESYELMKKNRLNQQSRNRPTQAKNVDTHKGKQATEFSRP